MSYDRRWLDEVGSEDSHGRALWALGRSMLLSPSSGITAAAIALFEKALPAVYEMTAPRAWAYSLVGIDGYLQYLGGASEVRRARTVLADRLLALYQANADDEWPWPEDVVTYANGILPQALLVSGARLGRDDMIETGLRSLRWLMERQLDPKGHFVPIGNRGWMPRKGSAARFDQQPTEAQHMIEAALEAYQLTGDRDWIDRARRCFEWFLGNNDLQLSVCDHTTGGCCDGLSADGVNQNQGAESTLAWLHALLTLHATSAAEVGTTQRDERIGELMRQESAA